MAVHMEVAHVYTCIRGETGWKDVHTGQTHAGPQIPACVPPPQLVPVGAERRGEGAGADRGSVPPRPHAPSRTESESDLRRWTMRSPALDSGAGR